MIVRNITYKGVSFAESSAKANGIVIQNLDKSINLRTQVFDRQNYHGSFTSYTLASGRLFSFSGVIFGDTRTARANGQDILNSIIVPESTPSADSPGFYELSFMDDAGTTHVTQAKVYSMPKYEQDIASPLINFSFELYSEDPTTESGSISSASGSMGQYGGAALPFALPIALSSTAIGAISVVNNGNFASPVKVTVTGSIVAPRITNTTTGRFYGLTNTTTALVYDGTSSIFSITDGGVDVSGYRVSGSKLVLVEPGTNSFQITGNNYPPTSPVTVSIQWRDTYLTA